jgi:hypothetical protein
LSFEVRPPVVPEITPARENRRRATRPLGKATLEPREDLMAADAAHPTVLARGMIFVHSCPPALRPHVEWAIAAALGTPVRLDWSEQPVSAGTLRAQAGWRGPAGTAGRLASLLRDWPLIRLEITEEPSPGCDGERVAVTPNLGPWRAAMSANGDVLVNEDRLRAVLATAADLPSLRTAVDRLLGKPWDDELDVYRRAGDGLPERWLSSAV